MYTTIAGLYSAGDQDLPCKSSDLLTDLFPILVSTIFKSIYIKLIFKFTITTKYRISCLWTALLSTWKCDKTNICLEMASRESNYIFQLYAFSFNSKSVNL